MGSGWFRGGPANRNRFLATIKCDGGGSDLNFHAYSSYCFNFNLKGDVILVSHVTPRSDLPPLPRVGIEFHLEKSVNNVKLYGRGPFECYPGRKAAAHVELYEKKVGEKKVGEMRAPYIVPGECGGAG